jgi:hypothetical protein
MSPENIRKQKGQPQSKNGLKQTLENILGRLRDGLDEVAESLQPARPQPVPIPIPVRRQRRR